MCIFIHMFEVNDSLKMAKDSYCTPTFKTVETHLVTVLYVPLSERRVRSPEFEILGSPVFPLWPRFFSSGDFDARLGEPSNNRHFHLIDIFLLDPSVQQPMSPIFPSKASVMGQKYRK